ncbi:MAG: glycosyltransferase family 39 protein, partial [Bacteroidales bacterium]|nr:glycosyltransferase family 39 protein [Bacteroidales bacterium]
MTEPGHKNNFLIFLFVAGSICLFYALVFRPVTYEAQGDFPAYLDLARQIFHLPGATATDLTHRSPLYSILLGLFLIVFGEPHYLVAMMIVQYGLIFASALLVYKIIQQLTGHTAAAFIAGIAGIANLTTVFFGFMVLSETLAMFLFTLEVWLLLRYREEPHTGRIIVAGLVVGLLILTRYNM